MYVLEINHGAINYNVLRQALVINPSLTLAAKILREA